MDVVSAFFSRALDLLSSRDGPADTKAPRADWAPIARAAGAPASRLFDEKARSFDAPPETPPAMVFWRDSSGWCPWCKSTWLLLEAMRLPYAMRTLPLAAYLRPGEQKPAEYLAICPDGKVPSVQFRDERDETRMSAPLRNAYDIFEELRRRWPERYPLGDAGRHDRLVGHTGPIAELEGATFALVFERDGARHRFRAAVGALGEILSEDASGPYCTGMSATAADLLLLNVLERTAAHVPFFVGPAALDSTPGWSCCAALLAAARGDTPGGAERVDAFADLAADDDSINSAFARSFKPPVRGLGAEPRRQSRGAPLLRAPESARRDAAARLARNHLAVGGFARRSAALPPVAPGDAGGALDDALAATARALLRGEADAAAAAREITREHGDAAAREAAAALVALERNVGVPRDMRAQSASALRAACALIASGLDDATAEAAAAGA